MLFYSVRLGDQNVVGQRHSTQLRLGKSRRAKNFVSNPTFGRSWFLGKKCKRTDPKVFVRLPTTLMISFNGKMRPQKFCKSFPSKSITITYSQLKSIWLSNLVSKLCSTVLDYFVIFLIYWISFSPKQGRIKRRPEVRPPPGKPPILAPPPGKKSVILPMVPAQ